MDPLDKFQAVTLSPIIFAPSKPYCRESQKDGRTNLKKVFMSGEAFSEALLAQTRRWAFGINPRNT